MSLAQAIKAGPTAVQIGGRCETGRWLDTLDTTDRTAINAAMADFDEWSTAALWRTIKDNGATVGESAFRRHRVKGCQCG